MAELTVRIVATDRIVFRGPASLVVLETVDGRVGIMPRHSPMMGILQDAPLLIRTEEGDQYAAVHGGFVTVDQDNVIILAEIAEMSHEISAEEAKKTVAALGQAQDDVSKARLKKAEVRLDVVARTQSTRMH